MNIKLSCRIYSPTPTPTPYSPSMQHHFFICELHVPPYLTQNQSGNWFRLGLQLYLISGEHKSQRTNLTLVSDSYYFFFSSFSVYQFLFHHSYGWAVVDLVQRNVQFVCLQSRRPKPCGQGTADSNVSS